MKSKAAVMVAPYTMEVREIEIPKLEKGCALIKIELSGICGTDKHAYKGESKQYAGTPHEIDAPYPFICGHETVGVIEDIDLEGAANLEFYGTKLKRGDRVVVIPDLYCNKCYYCKQMPFSPWCETLENHGNRSVNRWPYLTGGWSEYLYTLPNTDLFKLPEGASPELGSLMEIFVVAYALDKVKEFYNFAGEGFAFGDCVVVIGVGALGLAHVIKARLLGADKIIAIDKSDFRLKMAKDFGADILLNIRDTTLEERVETVLSLTNRHGADVVVGAAGVPDTLPEGIKLLRKVGTYLEVGSFVDTGEISIKPHEILSKNLRIVGVSDHPTFGYDATCRLLERYKDMYPVDKMITQKFGLADVDKALRRAMDDDVMKVSIAPWM